MSGWNIVVVFSAKGRYSLNQVRHIAAEVERGIATPCKKWMYTNQEETFGWSKIPLARGWRDNFAKLEMFSPDTPIEGGVLYLDLACVIGRPIELPPWEETLTKGRLMTWRDPWRSDVPHATGVMAWVAGTVTDPYEDFLANVRYEEPGIRQWGDDYIINRTMKGRLDFIDTFLKVRSYKAHKITSREEADVITFHGKPRPWDVGWSLVNN